MIMWPTCLIAFEYGESIGSLKLFLGYLLKKLAWNVVDKNVANLSKKPFGLLPREEVRLKIPADMYVHLLIYTFILPVIQVRIARPICQTCQFLPKQYTAITKCHHILSKNVFKEVLFSRSTGLFIHLFCWLSRSGLPILLTRLGNFCLNNIQPSQNAIIYYRKMCSRKF